MTQLYEPDNIKTQCMIYEDVTEFNPIGVINITPENEVFPCYDANEQFWCWLSIYKYGNGIPVEIRFDKKTKIPKSGRKLSKQQFLQIVYEFANTDKQIKEILSKVNDEYRSL